MQLGPGTTSLACARLIVPFAPFNAWWDMLSVNFVVELPESSGHNAVMTVVDAVSKRVHFIPMHMMVTAEGAA